MSASGSSTLRYWIGGVLGAIGAIAPLGTLGERASIIDVALGGGIWFAIGSVIGVLIDSVRSRRSGGVGPQERSAVTQLPAPAALPADRGAVAPPPQDGWYPDPFGRFQSRYWRGGAWTDQVASNGRRYIDTPD
jgi:hypothetical protein